MGKYAYNPNKNSIEYDGEFVAYLNIIDAQKVINLLNQQDKQLTSMAHGQESSIKRIRELTKENKQLRRNI